MVKLTDEQRAAIESRGKVIVSASAGSGKTFVMIEKLVGAIVGGADLDEVLAVTFTKKAAAQMKEKLRTALIARIDGADGETKSRLKTQLSKIQSANISTIHSLCARLLRTYFYVLGIDGGFEIISADDSVAKDLKARAIDGLFERYYDEDNAEFKLLLKCFMRKRNDHSLKRIIDEAYTSVRSTAHYGKLLKEVEALYTKEGSKKVCDEYAQTIKGKYLNLIQAVEDFQKDFFVTKNKKTYDIIFEEMKSALNEAMVGGIFDEKPPLSTTRKPSDSAEDKLAGDAFKTFKTDIGKRYNALRGDFENEQNELEYFLQSGKIAVAFSHVLMAFDAEYAQVKRDENKLDYNDLEHLTLELLADESVQKEINSAYKYVFVDEYQDVNPVQEEIISAFGGEVFLVGDVKQAIYGFRGSKSLFFAEKYASFLDGSGTALRLSSNFRSADGVLNFVNSLFSNVMRSETCGIDYAKTSTMNFGGGYPKNYGEAHVHIFGKEEKEDKALEVYSVRDDGRDYRHTREGLAVLSIVKRELQSKHFELKTGELKDTQPGDICVLTRKNKGGSAEGIVRALTDEGYFVSGAKEANICTLPEVKQFLDILSLIDNAEQDIPLVTALLSPLGGFSEDELAEIRIALKNEKNLSFRDCCKRYAEVYRGEITRKLNIFGGQLQKLRNFAEVLDVGSLADEILESYGFEALYGAGDGSKLKNVLKLIGEGASLTLNAFLEKVKSGGYDITAPASAPTDSIKIMTMHAAKGLEFPVVIIADICKTFKGMEFSELPFDEKYGFAPRCFDTENMLIHKTVLRRLCKLRADGEELKNELNLFYVACTRAMCNLHILAEEVPAYNPADVADAKCYADTFDLSKFNPEELTPHDEISASSDDGVMLYRPDPQLVESIKKRFMVRYAYADSVDLPVKSSASAILRLHDSEPYFTPHTLFGGEGETGTERGTAYHRFLELCDFSAVSVDAIESEIKAFLESGKMTEEQVKLLNAEELSEILKMPVFSGLSGARLLREQEFLCRLPAKEILPETYAQDRVLAQGAIDLIAVGDFGVRIIDYKYSHKTDEQLVNTYSKQLQLYKKATALILHIDAKNIETAIVNIHLRRQILL